MSSLADLTLQRLRALAEGNGLAPEKIELVKVNEAVYAVEGLLRLKPSFQAATSPGFGRAKSGAKNVFPSFDALREEVASQKKEFEKDGQWLTTALKEIEKEPGHGWGLEEADIVWPDQTVMLSASENCPKCGGKGSVPCFNCQGRGLMMCLHCRGTGQEDCPFCLGRGEDPLHPGSPCPTCNGRRFINCRHCQATGQVPCDQCQGKGGLPCDTCRGTGALKQEAKITKGAKAHFELGRTSDMPSGLLRMMERIGLANLAKGHIDVTMQQAAPDAAAEERALVRLTAQIPYADLVVKFAGTPHKIAVFGKKSRLLNVPAYLDRALEEARKILAAAARGEADIEKTSSFRLMREALSLALKGKTSPNDLRRLYPVGLSPQAAQEIMRAMGLALKALTARARLIASLAFVIGSAGVFAGFFFSGLPSFLAERFGEKGLLTVEILLPLLTIGIAWTGLLQTAQGSLKRKYPEASVGGQQDLGRRGAAALAVILMVYALFFLFR